MFSSGGYLAYLFIIAIFETNAAAKTFLVENATEPQQLRVIKRCELILNVVQRLQPALATIMNNTTHEKSARGQGDSSHGTKIAFNDIY